MTTEPPPVEPPGAPGPAGTPSPESVTAAPGGRREPVGVKPPQTRTSRAFSGLVAGAVLLILLLIFILENTQTVNISFLGASGHIDLGVALLLAAVGGALLAGALGAARIAQVRRHTRRYSRRR